MDSSVAPAGGELNAVVTREIIRIHMEAVGRGPRRAYTSHHDNVLFTILEGTLSPGERKLAANGDGESVRAIKRQLHRVMDEELRGAVSRLTARQVVASLNDLHLDPDVAVELFVLDSSLVQGNGTGRRVARRQTEDEPMPDSQPPSDGELNAAITREVIRIQN